MSDDLIGIGQIFINKEKPNEKVRVTDIGIYKINSKIDICFVNNNGKDNYAERKLSKENFLKLYSKNGK